MGMGEAKEGGSVWACRAGRDLEREGVGSGVARVVARVWREGVWLGLGFGLGGS